MCYNVNYLTKKRLEYARRLQGLIDESNLENEFDDILSRTGPVYFVNAFNHPDIPVITNKKPDHIQAFTWGLIPFWVKDPKQAVSISKMTLNARGEQIGIIFDMTYESVIGDYFIVPELQRTISVDIRYVLFVVEKFAGATWLINELGL